MTYSYTSAFLSDMRTQADTMADDLVHKLFSNNGSKAELYTWLNQLQSNHDLVQLPEAFANETLFIQAQHLPAWANPKLLQQGAALFARHAQVIMNLLGLLSLPYCYAGADGAMVLYLSERIRSDTGKRLAETGEFVWEVMAPDAFTPEGKGFVSCLKIRLMHAAARFYTYKSGHWNEAWGIPVNQEDMAGTNLSFSLMVIRGLRKFDYAISYADQQAFMHLWNVIGFLLGMDDRMLPADGKQANSLEEAIRKHQFRPSEQGRALTRSLVQYYSSAGTNSLLSAGEVMQMMRFLMGDEIANILALDAAPLPMVRLQLFKVINLINTLQLPKNTSLAYKEEYRKFKRTLPA